MTLKPDIKIVDFLRCVNSCASEVWFCTAAGDRLNLKSELSKYLFLAVASTPRDNFLLSGEISCDIADDYNILSDYLES